MKEYVAGFLFNRERTKVVLIKKKRPDWQKGYLNAVGGHIEKHELPFNAMVREFKEETGWKIDHWYPLVILNDKRNWKVWFYYLFSCMYDKVKTITDEKIVIVDIASIRKRKTIRNLRWLIPMALDGDLKKPIRIYEK